MRRFFVLGFANGLALSACAIVFDVLSTSTISVLAIALVFAAFVLVKVPR